MRPTEPSAKPASAVRPASDVFASELAEGKESPSAASAVEAELVEEDVLTTEGKKSSDSSVDVSSDAIPSQKPASGEEQTADSAIVEIVEVDDVVMDEDEPVTAEPVSALFVGPGHRHCHRRDGRRRPPGRGRTSCCRTCVRCG